LLIYGRPYATPTKDLWALLTDAELASAQKMPPKDRNTWLWCRAMLRKCLGIKLNIDPAGIQFVYNENGKPGLKDQSLHFNVSHTASSFLIGIAQGSIGVDLEFIPEQIDSVTADFVLNEREKGYCQEGKNLQAFAEIWTLKEALLKATGLGLVDDLPSIDVDPLSEKNTLSSNGWSRTSFVCPGGEVGAFVGRNTAELQFFHCS
jgi:4'-phosphopantetheinyl transferase